MAFINKSCGIRLLCTIGIVLSVFMVTCSGSQGSIEVEPEWIRLPTQIIRSELSTDLGVFFPNSDLRLQAVGNPNQRVDDPSTDRSAYLLNATRLPPLAFGYRVMNPAMARNYGTYELVELVRQVGDRFDQVYPGREFRVGDLSKQGGGTIRESNGKRVHSSHRNGLDVDVNLLYTDCRDTDSWHNPSCPQDTKKNLELLRSFIRSGPDPDESIVDSIYVSKDFLEQACSYTNASPTRKERYQEVLRYLNAREEHVTHFHLRIKCPGNSLRCPPPRPLPKRDVCR
ncbi:MAG: penicillin-insensitive murein endopeptidase [Deltaproteobacteria bacterium]|nr:penicillin-insensitive murein endopeptidase [Deltaproteobacteria bacterium]